jgi:hypothetical protein
MLSGSKQEYQAMITKPTVLVLGAGVSMPYGYPSGGQLLERICGGLGSEDKLVFLREYGIERDEVELFTSVLRGSKQPSVDAFLEHQPAFQNLGKLAIAMELMDCEDDQFMQNSEHRDGGIYQYLLNKMNAGWDELTLNRLSIVTFNYDRSLEHYLFGALKSTYGKSDAEVAGVLKQIRIIHVHGCLGPLRWQGTDGRPYFSPLRQYSDFVAEPGGRDRAMNRLRVEGAGPLAYVLAAVQKASEQIIIVSKAQPDTPEFESAKSALVEAERVYFLGFGYLSANLQRLGMGTEKMLIRPAAGKPYWGSGLGLGAAERTKVLDRFAIHVPDGSSNSLAFLKEYANFD